MIFTNNRRAQLDWPFVTFIIVVFGLLLIAPVMLKIFTSIRGPVSSGFGNVSIGGEDAKEGFDSVLGTAISFWDQVIVGAFFFSILLLVISAVFIDTNPLFIVIFVVLAMFTILFAPTVISSLDTLYANPAYTAEVAQLGFMNTIRENFSTFLVGLFVFLGIIIYGKIALFKSVDKGARQ